MKCLCKLMLAAIAFAVVKYFWGWAVWGILFQTETVAHTHLWRPEISNAWTIGMPLSALLIGLVTAFAFAIFHKAIKTDCWVGRGLIFGAVLFLLVGLGDKTQWFVYAAATPKLLFANYIDILVSSLVGSVLISAILSCKKCGNETSCESHKK